jgi:hypothetical protein
MNQAPDGSEEMFLWRIFLSLLPELFPLGAFTHSSRCGLLACAAPQLGAGRLWSAAFMPLQFSKLRDG